MTWRTGFTLTPGWSLLSLYKMNKILLVGPDPAWSEDAEPRRLSPSQSIPEGADENATCPHEPSTLFLPSHSAPLKPQMGASFSSDGALDAQFAAASQGLPALSTDPPSHPPVRQQLPESIQSGTQPLQRGRACRGRRETHSIHLHGNQTHSPPGSMLRKKNFNKPQNRPHIAP